MKKVYLIEKTVTAPRFSNIKDMITAAPDENKWGNNIMTKYCNERLSCKTKAGDSEIRTLSRISAVKNHNLIDINFALTDKEIEESFTELKPLELGDTLIALGDLEGRDNCISKSSFITIPKGALLTVTESRSGSRGEFFFKTDFGTVNLFDTHSCHPCGKVFANPKKIKVLHS